MINLINFLKKSQKVRENNSLLIETHSATLELLIMYGLLVSMMSLHTLEQEIKKNNASQDINSGLKKNNEKLKKNWQKFIQYENVK